MQVSDDGIISEPEMFADFPEGQPEQAQPESVLPDPFDQRHKLDFEGLLYLGYLTDDFDWMGHRFRIRTITTAEYLQVGLLQQKFQGTIGDVRAYTAAVVAACLETVDGKALPMPLERTVRGGAIDWRFDYIIDNWYPWVIDAVYERFQLLETRVEDVLDAMGKASG